MILKIKNVSKDFNEINVIKNLSMSVAKEEFVCIIGPSGCGKSTCLNIISGLIKPTKGEVVNNSSNISYVFQEDRLLPWKNVYENIELVNKKCTKKNV